MDKSINSFKYYLKELLVLAFPIFLGILGHTLIGITDVLVIAKYNIKSLAAVGIANSIFFTILILGIGILIAVSIMLSNYRGEKKKIKKYLLSTLVLSIVISCIFAVLFYLSKFLIPKFNFETELIPYIQEYITIVSFSMFGIFLFEGGKQFLQAYEIVKFPNFLSLCSVLLNLVLDIIFVFGFEGIPQMGSKGAAIATLIVRTTVGIIMFGYIFRFINFKIPIDFSYMKNILKTGIPIGFALLFEALAFNIVTILAGIEESIYAAVHSLLTTIAQTTYMLPLAISTALSVKVAYWYGANNPKEIKQYSKTAITIIISLMTIISLSLIIYPKQIISIFTTEKSAIETAIPLISIVAAYQIFDGFQAATGGILKGFKLTKIVSLTVLAGYWLIGAPLAYILVAKYNMSLKGYWLALAVSLCTIGLIQAVIAKNFYKSLYKF